MIETTGIQRPIIARQLKNGTVSNMAVDGSVTNVTYKLAPSANEIYRITSWVLTIQDGKGFDVNHIGSDGILTNGFMPKLKVEGVANDMLEFGIKCNGDIAKATRDMELFTFGTAEDILIAKWDIANSGQMIRLDGSQGDEIQVVIRDNMTALTSMTVLVYGYIEVGF